jgi:hypothetical protein
MRITHKITAENLKVRYPDLDGIILKRMEKE